MVFDAVASMAKKRLIHRSVARFIRSVSKRRHAESDPMASAIALVAIPGSATAWTEVPAARLRV